MLDFEPIIRDNRLMEKSYNWQQKDWPNFRYDPSIIEGQIVSFAQKSGRLTGLLTALPESNQTESVVDLLVIEALKTSAIEGEYLKREDVISSIRNSLGLNKRPESVADMRAQGIAELMLSVRKYFAKPLTEKMLFSWHRMLMKGTPAIKKGAWRTHQEPMQVISGTIHKPKIHFEAPPSLAVPKEMRRFIHWFNASRAAAVKNVQVALIRAAVTHLYFESIHPFEDGNGRIGRALCEKAISQALQYPAIISISKVIEARKKVYYSSLERAQKSNEISNWIKYFTSVILEAQDEAESIIDFVIKKTRFFDSYSDRLSERQLKVIRRMLEAGPKGFEGGMNARKYVALTRTSKATATRDLQELVTLGVLVPSGGGRSISYEVKFPK